MDPSSDSLRLWMGQWRSASVALVEQRKRELRGLSHQQALDASDALLSLSHLGGLHPSRRTNSGLVRQQALFHQRRVI